MEVPELDLFPLFPLLVLEEGLEEEDEGGGGNVTRSTLNDISRVIVILRAEYYEPYMTSRRERNLSWYEATVRES